MDNEILKQYYDMFGEFPYLLMTQSYNDEDYQVLMIQAINRNSPLTEEEIVDYFGNEYDLIEEETSKKHVEKNVGDLIKNKMLYN